MRNGPYPSGIPYLMEKKATHEQIIAIIDQVNAQFVFRKEVIIFAWDSHRRLQRGVLF